MTQDRYKKLNSIILLSVIILLVIYVFLRAYNLPFSHDESISYKIITGDKKFAQTANNHFMNTWLMYLSYHLFGAKEIFLRLPNVLAFILYSIFTYKLLIKINNMFLMLLGASFLLLNPYLLDYFSLARGYGLSLGFGLASLFFLLRQNSLNIYKDYIKAFSLSLLFSLFSSYSNFVFINLNIALIIVYLIELYFLVENKTIQLTKKKIGAILLILGLNFIFISIIIGQLLFLKNNNQLYFGDNKGFIDSTLTILIHRSIYFSYYGEYFWIGIRQIIIAVYFIAIIYQLCCKVCSPLTRITLLLSLMIFGSILQHYIFDTLYLVERTSLVFIPLFGFFIYYLFLDVYSKLVKNKIVKISFNLFILLVLCLPIGWHLINNLNLKYFKDWKYDAHDKDIMKIIDENHKNCVHKAEKITISNTWLFEPSIYYYRDLFSMDYINVPNRRTID
ncbi:MAG: hypothetical protein PHG67_11380 [Bacteroidales bacterium]|nr:hypothetical protein [Bacteroidales bacterium]